MRATRPRLFFHLLTFTLCAGLASPALALDPWHSYHSQAGYGTGTGMLEKYSPYYNFSFEQQGGIEGWIQEGCSDCHVGADWYPQGGFPYCFLCHNEDSFADDSFAVTDSACLNCHAVGGEKRGDVFTPESDVHVAAGMGCIDCHQPYEDRNSDHQMLKGSAIDTTEPTLEGSLSCTRSCHSKRPHAASSNRDRLNGHTEKVACETCHIGPRRAAAVQSRRWNVFDDQGAPATTWRSAGWTPEYKWYDNSGPGAAGQYYLPILGHAERRDVAGARIYPFNTVTVDWFVKTQESKFHDVIIVPEVRAADLDGDGTVTVGEMQSVPFYEQATLMQAELNFSISHGVMPASQAASCEDCHTSNGWMFNWQALGYGDDPGWGYFGNQARKKP